MTDYVSALAKLEWEGYAGIEWLSNEKYEDQTLNDLVQAAFDSWSDFKDDFDALENYLDEKTNEVEDEVSPTDTRSTDGI